MPTHSVLNQSTPLEDFNVFTGDAALQCALHTQMRGSERATSTRACTELEAFGATIGTRHYLDQARLANVHEPELHTHDERGNRIDQVEFHPAWHHLMDAAIAAGLHTAGAALDAHSHLLRGAKFLMHSGIEASVLCPLSMTYAVVPALRANEPLAQTLRPLLSATEYDPRPIAWQQKRGITMGMGMTEKQGGSDVRAGTTIATPHADGSWRLTGHKWFFSAPMCDAFLVLAQTEHGLGCFFLPSYLDDEKGSSQRNTIAIQRLKNKLGNRANASSEVEFDKAFALPVGEAGRGIATILEMGTVTRIDCALGTAGLMRQAVALALDHTHQRRAFGKKLIDQPLMRNTLADLALESEAATALALRLAATLDHDDDPHEQTLRRLLTPAAKFRICKRGAALAQEAMECLGGNGYVEDGMMARIYREMPLNSIWEGAGNIMAIDLLRGLRKGEAAYAVLEKEFASSRGSNDHFDQFCDAWFASVRDQVAPDEAGGRTIANGLAMLMQSHLLLQQSPAEISSAFCESRLGQGSSASSGVFGTLGARVDQDAIVRRALPR